MVQTFNNIAQFNYYPMIRYNPNLRLLQNTLLSLVDRYWAVGEQILHQRALLAPRTAAMTRSVASMDWRTVFNMWAMAARCSGRGGQGINVSNTTWSDTAG